MTQYHEQRVSDNENYFIEFSLNDFVLNCNTLNKSLQRQTPNKYLKDRVLKSSWTFGRWSSRDSRRRWCRFRALLPRIHRFSSQTRQLEWIFVVEILLISSNVDLLPVKTQRCRFMSKTINGLPESPAHWNYL